MNRLPILVRYDDRRQAVESSSVLKHVLSKRKFVSLSCEKLGRHFIHRNNFVTLVSTNRNPFRADRLTECSLRAPLAPLRVSDDLCRQSQYSVLIQGKQNRVYKDQADTLA